MTRQDYINKTNEYNIKIEQLQQEFYKECYLSESQLKQYFPHNTKVRILPTRDGYYYRNGTQSKKSDLSKIVGRVGTIDLSYNQYTESYINVRFQPDEINPEEYKCLVSYYQLQALENE